MAGKISGRLRRKSRAATNLTRRVFLAFRQNGDNDDRSQAAQRENRAAIRKI